MRDRGCVSLFKRICPIGKVERFLDAKEGNDDESRPYLVYKAAVLEADDEKLHKRIYAAKAAIDARLHEMQLDHGGAPEERRAISDALHGLTELRSELETRSQGTGSSNA